MSDAGKNEKKLCFVIGPIGEPGTEVRNHADWLLRGIIKPVFNEYFPAFTVQRADEIVAPGSISSQVITRLISAPLVVADMSRHNANAFYELAIRHMKTLPTIHLIHKDWKIPFDVTPYRAIEFAYADYSDLEEARKQLRSTVEEAIAPGFRVDNPVTYAIGRIELELHATPNEKVILERLDKIETVIAGRDAAVRPSLTPDEAVRALLTPTLDNPFYPMMRRNEVLLSLSDPSAGTRGFGGALGKGSSPASPPNPAAYEQGGIPNDKRAESQDYAKHSGGSSATSKSE
jgi:hypothetical protein